MDMQTEPEIMNMKPLANPRYSISNEVSSDPNQLKTNLESMLLSKTKRSFERCTTFKN